MLGYFGGADLLLFLHVDRVERADGKSTDEEWLATFSILSPVPILDIDGIHALRSLTQHAWRIDKCRETIDIPLRCGFTGSIRLEVSLNIITTRPYRLPSLFCNPLTRKSLDRLGFLPTDFSSQDMAYFRSTNMPRTIETLQQVIHGLYPTENTTDGIVPRVRVREYQHENLMGNSYVCGRLKELMLEFEKGTRTAMA